MMLVDWWSAQTSDRLLQATTREPARQGSSRSEGSMIISLKKGKISKLRKKDRNKFYFSEIKNKKLTRSPWTRKSRK